MPGCRDLTEIGHIEAKRKTLVLPQEFNVSVKHVQLIAWVLGRPLSHLAVINPAEALAMFALSQALPTSS